MNISPCLLTPTTDGELPEPLLYHDTGGVSALVVALTVVLLLHQLALVVVVPQHQAVHVLVGRVEGELLHGHEVETHLLVQPGPGALLALGADEVHGVVRVATPGGHELGRHQHQVVYPVEVDEGLVRGKYSGFYITFSFNTQL